MPTIENINGQWESLIAEIESELNYIEAADACGYPLSDATTRKDIQWLTFSEAKHFLGQTLNSLKLYQAVSLFSWFEKFIFEDANRRKADKTQKMHSNFFKVNDNTKIITLIKIWKNKLPRNKFDYVFDIIDDARHHRNWIAHGCRFTCLATQPLKNGDTYTAIALLYHEISQI